MSIADWMYNCNVTSLRSLEQKLDGSNSSGYSAVRPQPCVSSQMLPPLTRCPRPPQVAAYCVSAATSAFWLALLIKLNWHALPLLHFAQALTTQRFCRRTPYLMGKFWVMLKWYLLITFVGSVCGAIGWSFRTTASGLNYLQSDPILKVRIARARVLLPTTRVIPLSEKAVQG